LPALCQIAKVIGQVAIDALDQGLAAEIAILAKGHFAHQEIADLIEAIGGDQLQWVDDIAERVTKRGIGTCVGYQIRYLDTMDKARKMLKKLGKKLRGGADDAPVVVDKAVADSADAPPKGGKRTRRRSVSSVSRKMFGL
jgi:hypothetical protein